MNLAHYLHEVYDTGRYTDIFLVVRWGVGDDFLRMVLHGRKVVSRGLRGLNP